MCLPNVLPRLEAALLLVCFSLWKFASSVLFRAQCNVMRRVSVVFAGSFIYVCLPQFSL